MFRFTFYLVYILRSKKLLKQSLNIFSPIINLIKLEKIAQRSPEKIRMLRTCYRPQFLDLSLARQNK